MSFLLFTFFRQAKRIINHYFEGYALRNQGLMEDKASWEKVLTLVNDSNILWTQSSWEEKKSIFKIHCFHKSFRKSGSPHGFQCPGLGLGALSKVSHRFSFGSAFCKIKISLSSQRWNSRHGLSRKNPNKQRSVLLIAKLFLDYIVPSHLRKLLAEQMERAKTSAERWDRLERCIMGEVSKVSHLKARISNFKLPIICHISWTSEISHDNFFHISSS